MLAGFPVDVYLGSKSRANLFNKCHRHGLCTEKVLMMDEKQPRDRENTFGPVASGQADAHVGARVSFEQLEWLEQGPEGKSKRLRMAIDIARSHLEDRRKAPGTDFDAETAEPVQQNGSGDEPGTRGL